MKKIIVLNKREGETPLEALSGFRVKHKEYKDTKMTYAGRLDPMASGVLLVLAGEETKNKEQYLALDKEYSFEVLFGFATDTYDILGKIVKKGLSAKSKNELKKEIINHLKFFLGESIQKYPMYSSKTVFGKPLFSYARAGGEVDVPEKKIYIKKLKLEKIRELDSKKLLKNIVDRIKKVKGDFRQNEIMEIWRKALSSPVASKEKFFIGSFKVKCSSGTYVRGIANSLGNRMKIPVVAFSIKRTRVGSYSK